MLRSWALNATGRWCGWAVSGDAGKEGDVEEVRSVIEVLERHGLDRRHVPELSSHIDGILGEDRLLLSSAQQGVITEEEAGNALLDRVCTWLKYRDAAVSAAFCRSEALASEIIGLFAGWKRDAVGRNAGPVVVTGGSS